MKSRENNSKVLIIISTILLSIAILGGALFNVINFAVKATQGLNIDQLIILDYAICLSTTLLGYFSIFFAVVTAMKYFDRVTRRDSVYNRILLLLIFLTVGVCFPLIYFSTRVLILTELLAGIVMSVIFVLLLALSCLFYFLSMRMSIIDYQQRKNAFAIAGGSISILCLILSEIISVLINSGIEGQIFVSLAIALIIVISLITCFSLKEVHKYKLGRPLTKEEKAQLGNNNIRIGNRDNNLPDSRGSRYALWQYLATRKEVNEYKEKHSLGREEPEHDLWDEKDK